MRNQTSQSKCSNTSGIFRRPDSPYWWTTVYKDGKAQRVSTKCRNKAAAFEAAAELERAARDPLSHGRNTKTLRQALIDLVDWRRVHARDPGDIDHTFTQLRHEFIRHHFWHKAIDERADKHARRKGHTGLAIAAERRIRSSVSGETPVRDGQQTPMEGNILYYAQHATAACCRTCMEYWHAIPKGRELTEEEIAYLTGLLMRFVSVRMPQLPAEPEKIPPIRHIRPSGSRRESAKMD